MGKVLIAGSTRRSRRALAAVWTDYVVLLSVPSMAIVSIEVVMFSRVVDYVCYWYFLAEKSLLAYGRAEYSPLQAIPRFPPLLGSNLHGQYMVGGRHEMRDKGRLVLFFCSSGRIFEYRNDADSHSVMVYFCGRCRFRGVPDVVSRSFFTSYCGI